METTFFAERVADSSLQDLAEQAWQIRLTDRARSLELSQHLLNQDSISPALKAKALICGSFVYAREGKSTQGLQHAQEAQQILHDVPDLLWLTRLQIVFYSNHLRGDRVAAMTCATEIIRLAQQLSDHELECTGLLNLAILQAEFGLDAAEQSFQQVSQLALATNQKQRLAFIYYNWGWRGREIRKRDDRAELFLQTALDFAVETNIKEIQLLSLCELGLLRLEQGHASQSLEMLNQALQIAHETYPVELPTVFFYLGCHFLDIHQPQKALEYLLESFDLLGEVDQELVYQVHKHLAQCYEILNQPSQALQHFKLYHNLKEQLQGTEMAHKFRALQVIHQTENAQREAELEREKNAILRHNVHQLTQLNELNLQLSLRDPLTNLFNRRHLIEIGNKMLGEARQQGLSLATIMLDIDHFKRVNDTFGHNAGDQILLELSNLLRQWTRGSDVVARYGGEEFVLLLAQTNLEQSKIFCEKLRQKVEQHDWTRFGIENQITISLGICAELDCTDWAEMLNLADQKLYQAKKNGRNQTCY